MKGLPCNHSTTLRSTEWRLKRTGPRDFGIGKRLTNLPAPREVRLLRQPAPAAPRTTQPRPAHRSRPGHRRHQPRNHRQRNPHPGPAPGPDPQRRPPRCAADLPAATPRLHQPRPARTHRRTPRTARRHRRADHLRPAPAPQPPAHRAHPPHPPLPRHRHRHTAMFLTRIHDRVLRPASPSSPTPPARPASCAPPPPPTSKPSTASSTTPDSPPDHRPGTTTQI